MAIEDFYKFITRKRPVHSVNDKGETIKTYTESTINGYYNGPPSSNQQFSGGKWVAKYVITLLTDSEDIQHDDLVVIDSEDYRVIGFRADGGNQSHHYEVKLERLDQID